ncbi:MAG: DUF4142 domain-containing protein [Deltaproteobacteria bacterium]|nr:DUF4142 domain-containing protein [Deltaproteobacteria bacterium]
MSVTDRISHALGLDQQDPETVDSILQAWPERPRLGASVMIAAYGLPQEASREQLIWRNPGKYRQITVTRAEHHHDFPKPHMDFIEHTISYRVPPERAIELSNYDGSLTFDRTRGEMRARCDLEGHNILTLNLANDIATGKMTADEARKAFSDIVTGDIEGRYPDYTTDLRFQPEREEQTRFPDVPTIGGSPLRPDGLAQPHGNAADGEVLGWLAAADELEAVSAIVAHAKKLGAATRDFAQKLHEAHGAHLVQTLALGKRLGITPLETPRIDTFRRLNAGRLADLAKLDGQAFERAFVAGKIQGHGELLVLIDGDLAARAGDAEVKRHLASTRAHVAEHLGRAKSLAGA